MKKEVIIIGAGPAGIACAIQLKRMGVGFIILEKAEPGGLLHEAGWIENYPGFPGGISARELIPLMREHASELGIAFTEQEAMDCKMSGDDFIIKTRDHNYTGRFLVVATGTVPVKWEDCPLPDSAPGLIKYGVKELRDAQPSRIAIIGGGDAAFDYSIQLEKLGHTVSIFHRNSITKCLPLLLDRAAVKERIDFLTGYTLAEVKHNEKKRQLDLFFTSGSGTHSIQADYLIFATGRIPSPGFFHGMSPEEIEKAGSEGRLHFAGDVVNGRNRQTAIAVGDGLRIAMKIAEKIIH